MEGEWEQRNEEGVEDLSEIQWMSEWELRNEEGVKGVSEVRDQRNVEGVEDFSEVQDQLGKWKRSCIIPTCAGNAE